MGAVQAGKSASEFLRKKNDVSIISLSNQRDSLDGLKVGRPGEAYSDTMSEYAL